VTFRSQPTAQVDETATIGDGTTVWDLAQIREDARLGSGCIVGRGAYVGPGVRIGDNVKLQNYALVYEPAVLGDGVFVGPAAVLTNDYSPRSVDPGGRLKRGADWEAVAVVVAEGASLGARSVCVAPVHVGSGGSAGPACAWSRGTASRADGSARRRGRGTTRRMASFSNTNEAGILKTPILEHLQA